MKKVYGLIIALLFTLPGVAQSFQDEIQLMESLYGMEKKEILEEFVELDANEVVVFWEIYDEYEAKRKELGREKFGVMLGYVNEFGSIKPEEAENFMKRAISLRVKSDKLLDQYYAKIKNKTDPVVALQFYQAESYLADVIRMKLLEELFITKVK